MPHARLVCPVCRNDEARPIGLGSVARIVVCFSCGHRFASAPSFNPESAYHEGYEGFTPDAHFLAQAEAFFAKELCSRLPAKAAVLDVGCGNGSTLEVAGKLGLSAEGVDVSPAAVEICRARGLRAQVADFPNHDFQGARFDLVSFWDVLEHLPDPRSFVSRAADVLHPGGLLFAKVPGHGSLSVAVSSVVPPLARSILQVPHHMQLFTRRSITRLVEPWFGGLEFVQWGAMRAPARGGTIRRRVSRAVAAGIRRASGDANLYLLARRS